MAYWLVKSEPSVYGWDQLEKDKETVWSGVRNYAARINLRAMKRGDMVLYYHSNEGLNQMAYNRCVGTRYCINNCPYKVRRFNWLKFTDNPKFDYNQNSQLGKMVLNPDVVVRERGVVEKCTFCVQRIQENKLTAKLENRILKDGEVQPACVQACPAEAMTFGDLNDKHSNIFKLFSNERNYHLLEELHTLPKVGYLTKVRNKDA